MVTSPFVPLQNTWEQMKTNPTVFLKTTLIIKKTDEMWGFKYNNMEHISKYSYTSSRGFYVCDIPTDFIIQ